MAQKRKTEFDFSVSSTDQLPSPKDPKRLRVAILSPAVWSRSPRALFRVQVHQRITENFNIAKEEEPGEPWLYLLAILEVSARSY